MHTDDNPPQRTLRWLKRRNGTAHGAPVASFSVQAAASLPSGGRVVVVCHSIKAVNRVLEFAAMRGVNAAVWKKKEPMPLGAALVVSDFASAHGRRPFQADIAVFEVYASGSKQSYNAWKDRLRLARNVQEVAIYMKMHSMRDETDTEEQERADVHVRLMQVEDGRVRDDTDRGANDGRRDIRMGWGADPAAQMKADAQDIFNAVPQVQKAPLLTESELSAIQAGATRRWIEWARSTKHMQELQAWFSVQFSDESVLLELKYGALSNARALRDFVWGAEQQERELHGSDHPVEFAERNNMHMRRVHLHTLLSAAGTAEAVLAGRPVLLSRQMGKDLWRAIPWADPAARRDVLGLLRMTVYADDSNPDGERMERTLTAQRVLRRCGYLPTERVVKVRGERRRWWSSFSEFDPGLTPAIGEFVHRGLEPLLKEEVVVQAPDAGICEKPRFDGHRTRKILTPEDPTGTPVLLAPGIESSGMTVEGDAKDKERRTRSMNGLLKEAQDVRGLHGWKLAHLPGPELWVAGRVTPRLRAGWGSDVPNFARPYVHAVPGTVFVNFDFSNAHFRIAQSLVRQAQPRSTYFDALFAGGDVYENLAAKLGITRADAKLVALKLLNGGEKDTVALQVGADRAPAVVAAWKKHNPWVAYCAQRTKGIANKHSARASISVMLQRAEAQLLESTLAELDKEGVPYRTVLPLYDGALLLCETGLEAQLIQAVRAACSRASDAMGMPEMQCTAGAGPSWGVAQK